MSLAILCPGQGFQDADTLSSLMHEREARAVIDAFERETGTPVGSLATMHPGALQKNVLAQPLVCATVLAAFSVLKDRIPEPSIFAGYSIGELAAYGCAGWLTPDDTIRLAVKRAVIMDAASPRPTTMLAVRGLSRGALESVIAGTGVFISIVNGADRFVVAGLVSDVAEFIPEVERLGAAVTHIGVQIASHTPLLTNAVALFRAALESADLRAGKPVLAGIDGTPVLTRARAFEVLSKQVAETILWTECVRGLEEAGARVAIELPPGASLSKLVADESPNIAVRAAANFRSLDGLIHWVSKQMDA